MEKIGKIGLGGGCHWCTEAIFQNLLGVDAVEQGWIAAKEAAGYSEAVIVHFDPGGNFLSTLVEVHLHTHSCTANHPLRKKYRSAVYAFTETQRKEAEVLLAGFQKDFKDQIITKALTLASFKENSTHYLNYYRRNPDAPFCRNIIDPKLKQLMVRFPSYINPKKQ